MLVNAVLRKTYIMIFHNELYHIHHDIPELTLSAYSISKLLSVLFMPNPTAKNDLFQT